MTVYSKISPFTRKFLLLLFFLIAPFHLLTRQGALLIAFLGEISGVRCHGMFYLHQKELVSALPRGDKHKIWHRGSLSSEELQPWPTLLPGSSEAGGMYHRGRASALQTPQISPEPGNTPCPESSSEAVSAAFCFKGKGRE